MAVLLRAMSVLVLAAVAVLGPTPARSHPVTEAASAATRADWSWPIAVVDVVAPFVAPAHTYAPGHRGLDVSASPGTSVFSPADGVVAFAGMVAGRPVLTIAHDGGLVTTLEPVVGTVPVGTRVSRGEVIGDVALGGHAAAGTVHFGVREHGDYINPLRLVGAIDRAVLLPCC